MSKLWLNPAVFKSPLTPKALTGGRSCCWGRRLKNCFLSDCRADVVKVGAEHDQYGEEREAESQSPDAAAQSEAEPVDQPGAQTDQLLHRHVTVHSFKWSQSVVSGFFLILSSEDVSP